MPDMRDMLTPEVLAGMEKWMADFHPSMSLAEAVNEVLADWLANVGALPFVERPDVEVKPDA